MHIDAQTRPIALLGDPVAHSLSPFIHNTAFREQGHNLVYVATPVRPAALADAVAGLKALHFVGANVTLPHKQAVRSFMDELSPQAAAVGAVNTIVCRAEGEGTTLFGDNTDVVGFLEPLQDHADRLRGASMVVFGAGGGARAVIYALLSTFQPRRLVVAARSTDRAERLAERFADYDTAGALEVVPLAEAAPAVRDAALLVNATPLGMYPKLDTTPWPHAGDFSDAHIVYDLVYNPAATRLLEVAEVRGATTISGLDMLVAQAAAAYVRWTGTEMPVAVVRDALHKHLRQVRRAGD